jgi:transporter family-2 protein
MLRAYRGATAGASDTPGVERVSVTAMGSTGVAASLAFIAGFGGAVQIATQGRLGDRIGSLEALTCAVLIGAALAFVVLLIARRSLGGLREGFTGPKWMLLGGVLSVVIVLAITVAGPRIGIVATTAFLIVGQFTLATVIDRFGWFGIQAVPLQWTRVLGLALLAVGAALTLKR